MNARRPSLLVILLRMKPLEVGSRRYRMRDSLKGNESLSDQSKYVLTGARRFLLIIFLQTVSGRHDIS